MDKLSTMENKLLEHVDKEEKAVDKYGISCIVTRLFSFPVDNLSTGKKFSRVTMQLIPYLSTAFSSLSTCSGSLFSIVDNLSAGHKMALEEGGMIILWETYSGEGMTYPLIHSPYYYDIYIFIIYYINIIVIRRCG